MAHPLLNLDGMTNNKCLIIADDLTGGADSGARFATLGLNTLLVSLDEGTVDCSAHPGRDVFVVNTETRGSSSREAYRVVHELLRSYRKELFPLVYKKIDSTLRGNIGSEIDAVLDATGIRTAFLAPSFPEQSRVVAGGMLIVKGSPLAFASLSRNTGGESVSRVERIVGSQSGYPSALIDLDTVAAGTDSILEAVAALQRKGIRILVFDAVRRRHLEQIASAAFRLEDAPLLVGSAGLAGEVAKGFAVPPPGRAASQLSPPPGASRLFFVCGSMSAITRGQIDAAEKCENVRSYELGPELPRLKKEASHEAAQALAEKIASANDKNHLILKTCPPMPELCGLSDQITRSLGMVTRLALEILFERGEQPALAVTGGSTASSVFRALGAEGIEILGEVMQGIARGRLTGGRWNGIPVVTKAGGFGEPDCFVRIIDDFERDMAAESATP